MESRTVSLIKMTMRKRKKKDEEEEGKEGKVGIVHNTESY